MSTVHCFDTNIFKLNCFIEDNFLCTYNVQPLESTMKYSTILFNITGMHTFMYRFPNKGKNAGHLQSSYYPINAPHFWVYRQQCAFPPQFTPLSDSDNIPILCPSCPVSKLIFKTAQWGPSKQPYINWWFHATASKGVHCFNLYLSYSWNPSDPTP